MRCFFASIVMGMATAALPAAAGLKDATTTLKVGNWSVLRDVDAMTDKISCIGIYKKDSSIQLGAADLFISIAGGIESVKLRFGDEPAQPMRLVSKSEKDIRAVDIEGADFDAVLRAKRIRYVVLTLVAGIKEGDLDLAGIQQAKAHIDAGCPLPVK
jgi:hypothetical protein